MEWCETHAFLTATWKLILELGVASGWKGGGYLAMARSRGAAHLGIIIIFDADISDRPSPGEEAGEEAEWRPPTRPTAPPKSYSSSSILCEEEEMPESPSSSR